MWDTFEPLPAQGNFTHPLLKIGIGKKITSNPRVIAKPHLDLAH